MSLIEDGTIWIYQHSDQYENPVSWSKPSSIEDYDAYVPEEALIAKAAQCDALARTLDHITKDTTGMIGAFEQSLREAVGNSNVNVMQQRVEQARAALSAYKGEK